jgi:hypothetical protein
MTCYMQIYLELCLEFFVLSSALRLPTCLFFYHAVSGVRSLISDFIIFLL